MTLASFPNRGSLKAVHSSVNQDGQAAGQSFNRILLGIHLVSKLFRNQTGGYMRGEGLSFNCAD